MQSNDTRISALKYAWSVKVALEYNTDVNTVSAIVTRCWLLFEAI